MSKYNEKIIEYIDSLKESKKIDKSEILLLLRLSEEINNISDKYYDNNYNNYADIIKANDTITRVINSKKYIKQYAKEKSIIDRIDKLFLLCDNYFSNFDINNKKKEYNLKLVITCLEALLQLDLTFPEYARYYVDDKLLTKKGPTK